MYKDTTNSIMSKSPVCSHFKVLFVVVIQGYMDPKPLRVEGLDTSFEHVYYVCVDIWQRIVATYEGIIREYNSLICYNNLK